MLFLLEHTRGSFLNCYSHFDTHADYLLRREEHIQFMEETDRLSPVPKSVFIKCLKKAKKYKIGVSFARYNNIIKLHRNVWSIH